MFVYLTRGEGGGWVQPATINGISVIFIFNSREVILSSLIGRRECNFSIIVNIISGNVSYSRGRRGGNRKERTSSLTIIGIFITRVINNSVPRGIGSINDSSR